MNGTVELDDPACMLTNMIEYAFCSLVDSMKAVTKEPSLETHTMIEDGITHMTHQILEKVPFLDPMGEYVSPIYSLVPRVQYYLAKELWDEETISMCILKPDTQKIYPVQEYFNEVMRSGPHTCYGKELKEFLNIYKDADIQGKGKSTVATLKLCDSFLIYKIEVGSILTDIVVSSRLQYDIYLEKDELSLIQLKNQETPKKWIEDHSTIYTILYNTVWNQIVNSTPSIRFPDGVCPMLKPKVYVINGMVMVKELELELIQLPSFEKFDLT